MLEVLVDHGVKTKLQERFNVSGLTVKRALRGITDTKLAKQIRAAAINEFDGMYKKPEHIIVKK